MQWDPERSVLLEALDHRAIQIGLTGDAARRYVGDWTVSITDVTSLAREIRALVAAGDEAGAIERLPVELPYPLPDGIGSVIGAS